ncbi:MAG TPA: acyltransferase [Verrucomicrobia bacterium]|nr:acyltransferase [Verrucomicrobiota bacterium]
MTSEKKVNVGLVQMRCSEDKAVNMATALSRIESLAAQGAQIICLQELFLSRYFAATEDHACFRLASPVPGPDTEPLQASAAKHKVVLVASVFEKRAHGLYHNTAAVIDADGRMMGIYRKSHIPDDPGYYEKFYFAPGDTGYRVFKTRYASIGVLICWDQWYPEAARITSLMGAEILFYPTAIGWDVTASDETNSEQFDAWRTIQRGHAIANGVHVVAVNRTGQEGGQSFWGGSFVANPFGKLLYEAAHDEEALPVVTLDLASSDRYRTLWPFLRDRRIDTYSPMTARYLD